MTNKIFLALAFHNHQPVGNFDFVFAEAYQKAYLPMLEALERHPGVRLAIHNTGCLLDWLIDQRPDYIERLSALVRQGQIEIMSGGYYEPILVALPDYDKIGQLKKLNATVKEQFHTTPQGAWLAERIWEPHLAKPLHEAGLEYIIVDDTHFRYAGRHDEDMFGYYLTEEQGKAIKVFGTAKHLRYTVPWSPVADVIDWLRRMATSELTPGLYEGKAKVAVMGDDGEKFGLWPGTYEHCWENGWVEELFTALEANQDWITTIPPGEFAATHPPLGRIYMPGASYDEMTEWALPTALRRQMADLRHALQEENRTGILQFIKGGLWRNFLVKYPEVNQMHKKTLWVSQKVQKIEDRDVRQQALDHVWAAQCNCGYWHGLFGGCYLFHIRGANYRNLITAEALADAARGEGWGEEETADFTRNGHQEIILSNRHQWLLVAPVQGGALLEWDYRPAPYNLLNTISRREEAYHPDIVEAAAKGRIVLSGKEEQLESIHTETVRVKELGLEKKLHYDWYRRAALQDHFVGPQTTLAQFSQANYEEWGDFVTGAYTAVRQKTADTLFLTLTRHGHVQQDDTSLPVMVEKKLALADDSHLLAVEYRVVNEGDSVLNGRFGIENNWGLEGGQDPLTYYIGLDDEGNRRTLAATGTAANVTTFAIVSEIITVGVQITVTLDRPATVWFFPFESVTNSEAGYEANYQGTSVTTFWDLRLDPRQEWRVKLQIMLKE